MKTMESKSIKQFYENDFLLLDSEAVSVEVDQRI
jgi:hypothetical protein